MRRLLFLCALLASTAYAQVPTRATKDCAAADCEFRVQLDGSKYAYAYFTLTNTGTSTVAWEQSNDYGYNWVAAPYSKRIDATSANPAVASSSTTSGVYEVPLAGNVTSLRGRVQAYAASTTVSFKMDPLPKQVGPVRATLYDVTSAVNTALDTGALHVAGWSGVNVWMTSGTGTPAFAIYAVDDAGSTSTPSLYSSTTSSTYVGVSGGGGFSSVFTAPDSLRVHVGPRPGRLDVISGAVAGVPTRVRIEAVR